MLKYLFIIIIFLSLADVLLAEEDIIPREVRQNTSTNEHYFKLLVDKRNDDYYERAYRVDIYNIKNDSLIQQIDIDCAYRGVGSVDVFDYNFDGVQDFSVFEDAYAGPNTSRVYILRDSNSNRYFVSNIHGASLEFDSDTKTVFERNQCCAGTIVTTATYRIENNEMILLEEHCYKWNEDSEDLEESPMKECL